jgi:asparagine synthetase B (glutamine-hydrolysing)
VGCALSRNHLNDATFEIFPFQPDKDKTKRHPYITDHHAMCGLTLAIRLITGDDGHDPIFDSLCKANAIRGPDCQDTHTSRIDVNGHTVQVQLCASVLGLRGDGVTGQPLISAKGDQVLGWNGQVFQGMDIGTGNDTRAIFDRLQAGETLDEVLASIEGP